VLGRREHSSGDEESDWARQRFNPNAVQDPFDGSSELPSRMPTEGDVEVEESIRVLKPHNGRAWLFGAALANASGRRASQDETPRTRRKSRRIDEGARTGWNRRNIGEGYQCLTYGDAFAEDALLQKGPRPGNK
jgi:hypothetical protein